MRALLLAIILPLGSCYGPCGDPDKLPTETLEGGTFYGGDFKRADFDREKGIVRLAFMRDGKLVVETYRVVATHRELN